MAQRDGSPAAHIGRWVINAASDRCEVGKFSVGGFMCGWCWLRCLAAAVVVELLGMEVASMTRTQRKRFYRLHKRSVIKQQNEKARLEL